MCAWSPLGSPKGKYLLLSFCIDLHKGSINTCHFTPSAHLQEWGKGKTIVSPFHLPPRKGLQRGTSGGPERALCSSGSSLQRAQRLPFQWEYIYTYKIRKAPTDYQRLETTVLNLGLILNLFTQSCPIALNGLSQTGLKGGIKMSKC